MLSQKKYNIRIGPEIQSVKTGKSIRPVEHVSAKHGGGPCPVECEEKVCPCTRLEGMQGELRDNSTDSFNLGIRRKQPHTPGPLSPVPTEKGAVKVTSENGKGFARHKEDLKH